MNEKESGNTTLYRVFFHSQDKVYEIYARQLFESDMIGFIEVEELIFGSTGGTIVNPGEEKLKNEFSGVKRSYIPLHTIIRIDEVEREGVGKVSQGSGDMGKLSLLPLPGLAPRNSSDKQGG